MSGSSERRRGVGDPLYEPIDWALLRAPLLAAAEARDAEPDLEAESLMPADSRVQSAIEVASPGLAGALRASRPGDPAAERRRRKLRRYLIRMSTRATPFGLFAGVGMVEWTCGASDVSLASGPLVTRTRPDMAWLMGFIATLETDPGIRQRLPLVASSSVVLRGDRLFAAGASLDWDRSVRASRVVQQVMAAATSPTPFHELVAVAGDAPNATPDKAIRLVDQLWSQGFLRSALRPPLTGGDPASFVRAQLHRIPEASDWVNRIDSAQVVWARCDAPDAQARVDGLTAARRRMHELHPIPEDGHAMQTDAQLPLVGSRVHQELALETAEAARLLFALNPALGQPAALDVYRDAFVARYGPGRSVPLVDMLDPDLGLGPATLYQVSRIGPRIDPARDQLLLDLALQANRDRQLAVELTDRLVADLAISPRPSIEYPDSIEICIAVAATSAEALDAGDFQIVVGANVGAPAAGRHLGRFADLLGRGAVEALASVALSEQQRSPAILAEVVYAPARDHSANVAIRPAIRTHEIIVDATAGVPGERAIPINELLVSVHAGRFVISRARDGCEVVAVQGHMLNPHTAPPVVRFLFDAAGQQQAPLSGFSWGPALNLSFLPRVQRGRIVLAPARWRVPRGLHAGDADEFAATLSAWRTEWRVPRYVSLGYGDNRLLLDLEAADHIALLREELQSGHAERSLIVHEGLPGPDHAWLPGPTGGHLCELVVPLKRRDRDGDGPRAGPIERPRIEAHPESSRLRVPGSDWLYLKLYCAASRRDEIIGDALFAFADFALRARLCDGWFFIRYADPEGHLRIRFHGDAATLLGPLMQQVCDWARRLVEDGVCSRFAFDTYEREIDRYGGPAAMDLAESVFMADSTFVAAARHAVAEGQLTIDALVLAVGSTDQLLESLGLRDDERAAFYRAVSQRTPSGGAEYRRLKRDLRAWLGGHPPITLAPLLAARAVGLAEPAERLSRQLQLGLSATRALCTTYVHMHLNRLLETSRGEEPLVLELLARTRDGLERASSGGKE